VNIKNTLKTSVAAAALFAVVAPAHAGTVENTGATKVQLSGHFNKAFYFVKSGSASRATVADNAVSESRFRVHASQNVNEALSVSARFEAGFSSNRSNSMGVTDTNTTQTTAVDTNSGTDNDMSVRKTAIHIAHKQFGTLVLGQDGEATDGKALKGFNPAGEAVDTGAIQADAVLLQADGAADNVFTAKALGSYFGSYDGTNVNGAHYSTVNFGGFSADASFLENQAFGLGASFGGKMGGFAVSAGAGYEALAASSTTLDNQWMVSGGIKHDSGFSLSGGYGAQELKGTNQRDPQNYHVVVGYEAALTSMGKTGFAFQYLNAEDYVAEGDEGQSYQVGVQQGIADGVVIYSSYMTSSIDQTGTDFENVSTFVAGTKIVF